MNEQESIRKENINTGSTKEDLCIIKIGGNVIDNDTALISF